MAQYSTDFSEYTTSAAPSDWTERWDTANASATVEAGGDIRGNMLRIVGTVADDRNFWTWNDIDGDANRKTIEILARLKTNTNSNQGPSVWARASGAANSEVAMGAHISPSNNVVAARHMITGSYGGPTGGSAAITIDPDTWYWVRFQGTTSGSTHTYKIAAWTGAVSADPGWMGTFTSTFTEINQVGWVGVLGYGAQTVDCDYFAAGTGGDTAPGPSITLSSHTVTDITATTATIGITSDSSDGTLYWFVSTSATPPSEANLKAGTGSVAYGSDATPTAGANTQAITGLSANTTYYRHWFQESTVYKSSIATSTGFTTSAGVGEDPALRLDALGGSNELLDTDTGTPRAVGSAEYIVLGGTAGSRTLVKQGTVSINTGSMADITDAALETIDATYKVVLIAGNDDQGVYDATVVDRNA